MAIKIYDYTRKAAKYARRHRSQWRPRNVVRTLVLHQIGDRGRVGNSPKTYNNPNYYLWVRANFVILPDGKIVQLHPIEQTVWSSNDTFIDYRAVTVEFAGNFRDTTGRCFRRRKGLRTSVNCHRLTAAQIQAGRFLIQYLRHAINLNRILTHRQLKKGKENCPGPDIWYHVGQWAVDKRGLSDGGPGYKRRGYPIPNSWRTWGRVSVRAGMAKHPLTMP